MYVDYRVTTRIVVNSELTKRYISAVLVVAQLKSSSIQLIEPFGGFKHGEDCGPHKRPWKF